MSLQKKKLSKIDVRIVSQTANISCNPEMRDGRIRSTIFARKLMPKRFDSKKDFYFYEFLFV